MAAKGNCLEDRIMLITEVDIRRDGLHWIGTGASLGVEET